MPRAMMALSEIQTYDRTASQTSKAEWFGWREALMARKPTNSDVEDAGVIQLPGAAPSEVIEVGPRVQPDKGFPRIIQNYYFGEHVGDLRELDSGSDPVGPAADQCYKYVIENQAVDLTWNASIATNPPGCVFLSSATIEKEQGKPGVATFVICCEKGDDNKCKNCATVVTLTLTPPGGGNRPVTKQVKVFCRKT
jgi:hypothetical protein